ncbi:MAG: hypothetical protein P4L92_19860 [Rudaea sp.]|nr:hypothetical protein [Rudaea sp.]
MGIPADGFFSIAESADFVFLRRQGFENVAAFESRRHLAAIQKSAV